MSIAGAILVATMTLAAAGAALVLYILRFMVGLFLDNPIVTLEAVPALPPSPSGAVTLAPLAVRTRDGVPLSAFVRASTPRARGVVVFAPEFGGTQDSWAKYAGILVDAGFAVVTFDFRSTGASPHVEGYVARKWCTRHEVDDLLAVIEAARAHAPSPEAGLALLGISRGGVASLAAAAHSACVRGMVVEGVASTREVIEGYTRRWARIWAPDSLVDALPALLIRLAARIVLWWSERRARVTFPLVSALAPPACPEGARVLFIYGSKDRHVEPEVQTRTFEGYAGAKELWVVPGARHNGAITASPEEYRRRVVAFIEGALGLPALSDGTIPQAASLAPGGAGPSGD